MTRACRRMQVVKPSAIRELLHLGADPSIISFGGGYPDATLFPLEQLGRRVQSAIFEHGQDSLQYTVSNGSPHLRAQIAGRMGREGVTCTEDEVLILHGGQQGLDLVAKLLVDEGDVIITEDPTFLGGLIAFNPCEPRYAAVPMDDEGMDTDALERALRASIPARSSSTRSPTSRTRPASPRLPRRRHLIELANRYDVIVLEDGPYRETRFEGTSPPTIKSLDTEGRVIYLGSFSKILAPGLRLGWAVASEDIIEQLGLLKLAADTQCSTLNMAAVSLYLDSYDIESHIDDPRGVPAQEGPDARHHSRDVPRRRLVHRSAGRALHLADVSRRLRHRGLHARARAARAKVAYVPGATFFPTRRAEPRPTELLDAARRAIVEASRTSAGCCPRPLAARAYAARLAPGRAPRPSAPHRRASGGQGAMNELRHVHVNHPHPEEPSSAAIFAVRATDFEPAGRNCSCRGVEPAASVSVPPPSSASSRSAAAWKGTCAQQPRA